MYQENQHIASLILHIYADYNKRLGAYKIAYILQRDYGIHISVGRVYRLMKQLQLPKMSTDTPWIVNTFLDNFFKVVLPVLYRGLISQRGMYPVMVIPVYIIP